MDGSHSTTLPRPLAVRAAQAPVLTSTSALGAAFVALWSSGYIAGKVALEHAGAFNLLLARFGLATIAFALLATMARLGWPNRREVLHSAVVGVLSLALQFGAVYLGVQWGAEGGV